MREILRMRYVFLRRNVFITAHFKAQSRSQMLLNMDILAEAMTLPKNIATGTPQPFATKSEGGSKQIRSNRQGKHSSPIAGGFPLATGGFLLP